ncbi:hypothetical protein NBRC116492_34650 [Aurantivibrio infirmus]
MTLEIQLANDQVELSSWTRARLNKNASEKRRAIKNRSIYTQNQIKIKPHMLTNRLRNSFANILDPNFGGF